MVPLELAHIVALSRNMRKVVFFFPPDGGFLSGKMVLLEFCAYRRAEARHARGSFCEGAAVAAYDRLTAVFYQSAWFSARAIRLVLFLACGALHTSSPVRLVRLVRLWGLQYSSQPRKLPDQQKIAKKLDNAVKVCYIKELSSDDLKP
ncbi:MAG: hypothetical protein J6R86_04865 [Lentisphaeria bacterium]|nr:hypothetical protein [Lentisphaeria bacterium]